MHSYIKLRSDIKLHSQVRKDRKARMQTVELRQVYCFVALLIFTKLLGCSPSSARSEVLERDHQIVSSSMVPAFWGHHVRIDCKVCRHQFRVDPSFCPPGAALSCPRCERSVEVGHGIIEGDLVQLMPATQIERLDVVVFEVSESQSSGVARGLSAKDSGIGGLFVKRIWGLPDEELYLAGGDLFVDGVRFQKTLKQLARVAVPICQLSQDTELWTCMDAEGGAIDLASFDSTNQLNLEAGSQLILESKTAQDGPAFPLFVDRYQSNSGVRRAFRPVSDLGLKVTLNRPLNQNDVIEFKIGAHSVTLSAAEFKQDVDVNKFTVALCDQRLLLSTGVKGESDHAESVSYGDEIESIVVLVSRGSVTISEVRVFRDLYLSLDDRLGDSPNWRIQQANGEYCLLGDNLPVSLDSRQFGPISRSQIQGRITDLKSDFGFR